MCIRFDCEEGPQLYGAQLTEGEIFIATHVLCHVTTSIVLMVA